MAPGPADLHALETVPVLEKLAAIHPLLPPIVGLTLLAAGAVLAYALATRLLVSMARAFAERSPQKWDDALVDQRVFSRLAQVLPALIIYVGVGFVPDVPPAVGTLVRNVSMGYMVLMMTVALTATLSAANQVYEHLPVSQMRPLKGFVQLAQIVIYVLGAILAVAAVLDRSPLLLLSGFGAMTAILLLVFKDTILSLVASVQLTAQDLLRVGDWIEMPQFGADGDVIDVQLHTVKVQNWDKTITTIPTHRLITDSFKNWRGMSESGGRRIKRAINIDTSSIRFLSAGEARELAGIVVLRTYLRDKALELADYNATVAEDGAAGPVAVVNQRRLTNVGTFRAYAFNYLKKHPDINSDMTLLVRQLSPGPEGLPVEIYCFTNTTEWGAYENIQSDIFDHFLAIVPQFGLRVFQKPSGSDLSALFTGDTARRS
jgi:miniconductance mechanosensitive channel